MENTVKTDLPAFKKTETDELFKKSRALKEKTRQTNEAIDNLRQQSENLIHPDQNAAKNGNIPDV